LVVYLGNITWDVIGLFFFKQYNPLKLLENGSADHPSHQLIVKG